MLTEAKAQYQIDTYHLAVVYNTTILRNIFIDIISNYYTFRLKQNITTFTSITKQIDYLVDTIESRLLYLGLEPLGLRSSNRHRRGLIDGLGSIIKSITGNLDVNDAIKFENEIKNTRITLNKNALNLKKTLSLTTDFMKNYERNLDHIQNNQKEIYRLIDRYSTQANELEARVETIHIFDEIERSFQQLYDRLESLENAITFSHLGKLHPSIIDSAYLIEELIYVQNDINSKLAFAPNIKHIHLWEKAIEVKAYSTNDTITFILEIPLVANQPYNLLHLYSIPTDDNSILIPKNPILILGNDEFAYPHEPCTEIEDNNVICKHLEWQKLQLSDDCIAQLIQHQEPHNCTYATAKFTDKLIQQIEENSWIVIMKQEEVIKTTCDNDVQYQRSKGAFLITIDNNCKIQVMEKTLSTHEKYINIKETIPLPRAHQTPKATKMKINLEDLELDNLKEAIKKSEAITPSEISSTSVSSTPSWYTICLYTIFIVGGLGAAAYKCQRRFKSALPPALQQADEEANHHQPLQPSVRLSLKEGRVMSL